MKRSDTCSICGSVKSLRPSGRWVCAPCNRRYEREARSRKRRSHDPTFDGSNAVVGVKGFTKIPLEQRFWSKVEKTDGCWLWQASANRAGYGSIYVDGRHRPAHRVAWEMIHGPMPDHLEACHTCDNPSCVRPDHIFPGTHLENIRDAVAKGRNKYSSQKRSECYRGHPFTPDNTYTDKDGTRLCRICRRAATRAARIRRLNRPVKGPSKQGEDNGFSKLRVTDVISIRERYAAGGTSLSKLASEYGMSVAGIHAVVQRRNWAMV